jgi:hypothetical protein
MATTSDWIQVVRRLVPICALAILVCASLQFFAVWPVKEDHRTTYDKEGRHLPGFCLRELAVAMHRYDEKNGRLPPAALYGKRDEPLLSWRVLLLPYLDQEDLFRQFKLDEPWNSPHNIQLLPKIPSVYSPLEGNPPLQPNTTLFQVFVGRGTAFEGREGLRLKEDFARRSYTILIVEAGRSVPWSKPEDILYDENQPLPQFGGYFMNRFHVVMADGTAIPVRRQDITESTLRAAIVRDRDGTWPWENR